MSLLPPSTPFLPHPPFLSSPSFTHNLSPPDVSPANVDLFDADPGLVSLASMPLHDDAQQIVVIDELVLQQQQQQQLSTPTMHPNLVSTLKSIISPFALPPPRPLDRQQGAAFAAICERYRPRCTSQGNFCLERLVRSAAEEIPPAVGFEELQVLYASPKCPGDQQQAAVVPVDLIQNRRPFKCTFAGCNKTFKNPQTLKMHRKTHYSEDTTFRLGTHSLATFPPTCKAGHNKKIPSKCPVCKRTFVGLYELRRHFGRKHSKGEKPFSCRKCGKKFYIDVDLRDHEKLCGEPLECKCGMKFAFKCNLVAHKKTHPECQDLAEDDPKAVLHSGLKNPGGRIQSKASAKRNRFPASSTGALPLNQIPVSCDPALPVFAPSTGQSLDSFQMANPILEALAKENMNLSSLPAFLQSDVKSEEMVFSCFPSAILGLGPVV